MGVLNKGCNGREGTVIGRSFPIFPQPSISLRLFIKTLQIITSCQNWDSGNGLEAGEGQDHKNRNSLRDKQTPEACAGDHVSEGISYKWAGIIQKRPIAVTNTTNISEA